MVLASRRDVMFFCKMLYSIFTKHVSEQNKEHWYSLMYSWPLNFKSISLILVPVRDMKHFEAAKPHHHKPFFNYSPHKAVMWIEHHNWIHYSTISFSLAVSPQIQQHYIIFSASRFGSPRLQHTRPQTWCDFLISPCTVKSLPDCNILT